MQVKDLTVDELKTLIRTTVVEVLEEFLPDPDEECDIKEAVKQELLTIRQRRETGQRAVSMDEALRKLGLDRE